MKERSQKEIDWEEVEAEATKMDCGESCECTRSSIERLTGRVKTFIAKRLGQRDITRNDVTP